MNYRLADRIIAASVLLFGIILFSLTVAPTVSFWDPGERIAVSHGLQIPHPPGAPFYMLVGRIFSMFAPTDYVALSVNMISVLSSAFTILLTFVIVIQLVREWKGPRETWTSTDHIMAYAGGIIGAITLAASDSFWFDAVEAETYAFSTFFTATCVWLTLQWSDRARRQDAMLASGVHHAFGSTAERWLLVIAYLYGLAIGVHLLSLLSIFFVTLIVYFQHFESPEWDRGQRLKGLIAAGAISCAVFLSVYPGMIQYLPEIARQMGTPVLFLILLTAIVVGGLYITQTRGMRIANMAMLFLTVVLVGYSTYALIFIRSAANPPIDQNNPETVDDLISYLKREQYGSRPLLRGNTYDPAIGRVNFEREVLFPRRHSPEPHHLAVYQRYNSDLDFFIRYQVGHMYLRYFLWNFMGRAGDVQDSPAITGFRFIDSSIEAAPPLQRTPSEQASRNRYFALPLLLGLIGAGFHLSRDWRRAFAVGILFLVTGIGIIVYLNQSPMQPRERDYSYVGSFFAFSIWVGIGATGLIQLLADGLRNRLNSVRNVNTAAIGLGVLLFAAVPVWMLQENYFDHDRSSNYVPREYALNMLESVDQNAILFTNGDNDTFPLWYLQEVEGIRRDVRVVNLSLLNTPWYVHQLKHQQARESAPLPISMTDAQIDNMSVIRWDPADVSVAIDENALRQADGLLPAPEDTAQIQNPMRWRMEGRPFSPEFNILHAADQVLFDIIRTNARQGWTRPVYFAVTVSPDGQLGLDEFLQMEGQAFQILPIRHDSPLGRVIPGVSDERLLQFEFTGLDDPGIYFDENIRRMTDNYRNVFSHTAQQLAIQGEHERARRVLDLIMERVPFETIPGDERSYILLARAYDAIGDRDMVTSLMTQAEPATLHRLEHAQTNRQADLAAQYVQMIRFTYLEAGAYDRAADFSRRIAEILGDPTYEQSADELRELYRQQRQPADPEGPAEAPES